MDNLRGALIMIATMFGFAIEDACIKIATQTLPLPQILVLLGAGGATIFAAALLAQRRSLFEPEMLSLPILLRAIGEIMASIGMVSALAFTSLAATASILQATPIAVTLGAVLFLGETVGWRRWLAILAGFVGVMLVIRPGFESFDSMSLFALMAVLGLAMRDIATRRVPAGTSSMQLSFLGFLASIPAGLILQAFTGATIVRPSVFDWTIMGLTVAFGAISYYGIVAAMRIGDVGFITPFRYARLPFAIAIGMTVFAERPDLMTFAGSAVIVGSGLYTVWRERKTGQRRTASLPMQGPARYDLNQGCEKGASS
ncbi:DMT family transporter [Sulfitobacter sp. LCG007]